MSDDRPRCEACQDEIDEGQSLCEDCKERSYGEWSRYQDWLRGGEPDQEDSGNRDSY